MKTERRILALILACLMVCSLVACTKKADTTEDPTTKTKAEEMATEKSATGEEDEKEIYYGIEPFEGDTPVLKWYTLNQGSDITDLDTVEAALNELLKERYNLNIDWTIWDGGEYDEKMNLIINSGEDYDICFTTSGWLVDYSSQVEKGAFAALDEYIDEYEPSLWAVLPEAKWDATRCAGKVYAVPNTQKCFDATVVMIRKDLADEFGLDVEGMDGLSDGGIRQLFPFFEWVKENHPELYVSDFGVSGGCTLRCFDMANGSRTVYELEPLSSTQNFIYYDTDTGKAVDGWDVWKDNMDLEHEMFQKGYIRQDIATVTDDTADIKADRYAVSAEKVGYTPGAEAVMTNYGSGNYEWYMMRVGEPVVKRSSVLITMNGISATSKNIPAALKFLNVLYRDPEVSQMISFGVEGLHYKINDEGLTENLNAGFFWNNGWAAGLQFLVTPTVGNSPDLWEKTQAIENASVCAETLSFGADLSNVSTEMAQINEIKSEHKLDFILDDTAYEAAMEEMYQSLYKAGLQNVLDEIQAQLDAWAVD